MPENGLDEAKLVGNAKVAGATPLWELIGEGATVFDYGAGHVRVIVCR